jgi:hypothetical protein
MVWDETPTIAGRDEPIELVGTHLRLTGLIALGRFGRLTDLFNASSGYIRVRDARLLRRNGEPTTLVLPELMVDQDEISFIAQTEAHLESGNGAQFDSGFDQPTVARTARPYIMFTPGHTVTGSVHVFGQTDLAAFVDSSDPRFVPVVDATARSLADRRIVSHYPFVLINRTQLIAASEVGRTEDAPTDDTATDDAAGEDAAADGAPAGDGAQL